MCKNKSEFTCITGSITAILMMAQLEFRFKNRKDSRSQGAIDPLAEIASAISRASML